MRSAVLSAPKTLQWRDAPVPHPKAGEVVVQIKAALTCGTDLKTFRRGHPKLAFGPFGHEAAGDILEVGEGVQGFAAGDPVMWVQTAPCAACAQCLAGRENLCERLTEAMALGAYAEALVLPAHIVARNLYAKPATLSYIEAAFLEPFSCIVHGWRVLARADAVAPMPARVAIVGAGTIGLLHLAYARHAQVPATVIARHTERLALAKTLGAAGVRSADFDTLPDELAGAFPAVIECGGTAESWQEAVRLAAPGGRVLFFSGLPKGTHVPLDATRVHYEELTCLGSFHFTPDDVRAARELLLAGVVPARSLVTDVLPLGALAEAFSRLDGREGFKYALIPGSGAARWI
ncbi:MAG TPA: alcohol dehydrogenase catalytic domain-containing protein [Candidatus Acidoferrales bacterium]|nr:alcohol dehydrogenase catalytic domain-containing protein [Candidatus Acidoferrales bacterium]